MGSSLGFGSNPDNTPGLVETQPPASFPRPASARPKAGRRDSRELDRKRRLRPINALLGLAFALAPELLFLNRAA